MARTAATEKKRLKLGKLGPRPHKWTIVPGLTPEHLRRLLRSKKYAGRTSFQHIIIAEGFLRDTPAERKRKLHRLGQQRQRKKMAAAIAALAHVVAPNKTMIVDATLTAAANLINSLQNTETKLKNTLAALKARQQSLKSIKSTNVK